MKQYLKRNILMSILLLVPPVVWGEANAIDISVKGLCSGSPYYTSIGTMHFYTDGTYEVYHNSTGKVDDKGKFYVVNSSEQAAKIAKEIMRTYSIKYDVWNIGDIHAYSDKRDYSIWGDREREGACIGMYKHNGFVRLYN